MSDYLDGLNGPDRALLARINKRGLDSLRRQLAGGDAVAFLGAGTSAPLYPLWNEVVNDLLDRSADRLSVEQAATFREQARTSPDAIVQIVQDALGHPAYREALRELFGVRRDPLTGRSFTPVQELVARCNFRGVITTNYDQGIVSARSAVRPLASATGFSSWTDEDAMDSWRTGDVFTQDELPILYAHGHHNQPDAIVLATTEYRRAYRSGLDRVLRNVLETGHVVWIGFSFTDRRIMAILHEIEETAGPWRDPGRAPRHVAVIPWEPPVSGVETAASDPQALARLAEIEYGCRVVLYPAPAGDHRALATLLSGLVDVRYPSADNALANSSMPENEPVARLNAGTQDARCPQLWVHGGMPPPKFVGRAEELRQLDRWAGDPDVRVIGVTAWGGVGKTSLVRQWIQALDGMTRRPMLRGAFAWSFYDDNSVENWATGLLKWARDELAVEPRTGLLEDRVLDLLAKVPLLLILDGLEVGQDTASQEFGRLLDGTLRTVLTLVGQLDHMGLVLLTSRFPFADLEPSIGGSTRILEVPPLTQKEGAELLRTAGAAWLPAAERTALVDAVDGHALALGVLAAALAERPPDEDLQVLRAELSQATRTNTRVAKVLHFYSVRLDEPDRRLIAVVSLFQRPIDVQTICTVAALAAPDSALANWSAADIVDAVRRRLPGLLEWNLDASVTAHPLVREAFRPFALTGQAAQHTSDVVLADLPRGPVRTLGDARLVVEMIELLLSAGQWQAADDLYRARSDNGAVWRDLPAAPLGLRAAQAFVFPIERREAFRAALGGSRVTYYLNTAGVSAAYSGDLLLAEPCLIDAAEEVWAAGKSRQLPASGLEVRLSILSRSRADLAAATGDLPKARELADEAVTLATRSRDLRQLDFARASHATAEYLAGALQATERLLASLPSLQNRIEAGGSTYIDVLIGTIIARILIDTERIYTARRIILACLKVCLKHGWNADEARCKALLGRSSLVLMDSAEANALLTSAVNTYAAADHVVPLAATLADLAESHRRAGELTAAEIASLRAISLASTRGLVPTHSRALAVRAAVHGDLAVMKRLGDFGKARDYANSALSLATRTRQLPWCELAALQAHQYLDQLEGRDHNWRVRAQDLHGKLITTDLDPLQG